MLWSSILEVGKLSLGDVCRFQTHFCLISESLLLATGMVRNHKARISYVEISTFKTSECIHVWRLGLSRGNWVKMKSLGWVLIQCNCWTWVQRKDQSGHLQTKRKVLRRNSPAHLLILACSLQNCEKINFCYLNQPACGIRCGSPRRLITTVIYCQLIRELCGLEILSWPEAIIRLNINNSSSFPHH